MVKGKAIILKDADLEPVELLIRETLLKGENVIIPEIGHLEVKSLSDRRTVLFKKADTDDSFLRVMSEADTEREKNATALYSLITTPLKEGKVVNLPQVGVFRPAQRENGELHISFIPSSSLRKLINGETDSDEVIENIKNEEIKKEINELPVILKKEDEAVTKEEITIDKTNATENSEKPETVFALKNHETPKVKPFESSFPKKTPQVGDQLVPQDHTVERKRKKNIGGIMLLAVAAIALLIIIVVSVYTRNSKNIEERERIAVISPGANESISLPALAEQHYGHSAFWIYIYEANLDKLNSPINIPKSVSLVIPDLKAEYGVDITDSLEIRRANLLAAIVLKEGKNRTNDNNK
jgi:nucleoid DNA-binding protein